MLSRDSHESGAELMKHQFQNKSGPVFITPEVKEFKLGLFKKGEIKRKTFCTTFCKHERRQNIADCKIKYLAKENNVRHLERDTFCALSECSPVGVSQPPLRAACHS